MRRIYVRAPNWVGDFVMATAAFERIRQGFPQAEITLGLRPYLKPLLSGSNLHDKLLDCPRMRGVRGMREQVAALRAVRPDLAIVLPNSLATGLVPFFARVPKRYGYRQGRSLLMTAGPRAQSGRKWWRGRRGPRRIPEPMPRYYDRLLDLLELPPGRDRGVLAVGEAERQAVDAWLAERGVGKPGQRLVLLTAGASYGASKMWVPERFAAVARHFADRDDTVPIFLAGPAEVEMVTEIARQAGCLAAVDPVLPLDQLKALVARCSLMISTDTGPRHIAVAFDKPVVCLIGPTDRRYTDYGLERTRIVQRDLDCMPCQRKICPLGHHDCMNKIEVDEVVAAGEQLLAEHGQA